MKQKIIRFEKALANHGNFVLIDIWNELEVLINNEQSYIETLEADNMQLMMKCIELQKQIKDTQLLFSAYENMKSISKLNAMFANKGFNPLKN